MRTGRGRQIAGELTKELRRQYIPSKQYGEVFPLIYSVLVCPECLYAAYFDDFSSVTTDMVEELRKTTALRREALSHIFPDIDFRSSRGLSEGIASYVYASMCYEYFPPIKAPLFKAGQSQLRAAWLCGDMHKKNPQDNFDYLSMVFYRKARYFYFCAVEAEQDGSQPLLDVGYLGPDIDNNYGYDGVLYIAALLEFAYGPRSDAAIRKERLESAKRTAARIFGMGKASKAKPSAILDNAREVHEAIGNELKTIEENI